MELFFGLFFGAIGSAYLVYAKRTYNALFAITGGLLILFPYFVSGALVTLLVGGVLIATPFVWSRFNG